MRDQSNLNIVARATMMGSSPLNVPTRGRYDWIGVPKNKPLVTPKRHPSQYSALRFDQIERRRKLRRKENWQTFKRYRSAPVEDNQ